MKIGNLKIDIPVFLAPMAGVTDFPYRQIIREMGCQLLYSEMVSSKGLVYGSQRSLQLMEYRKGKEGLIAIQLFGDEPETMAEAARLVVEEVNPDIIDINMGCPTPKIVKNGSGSALMKKPELAGKIINAVAKAVDVPVTFKMRTGWDKENINAKEIALIGQENGAKAVAIHGRTREQLYSGKANWDIISRVKKAVSIPVIGNGDIFTPDDARNMINRTNCDSVMIARGCQGNPWLLKRTICYLQNNKLLPLPTNEEKIEMALYHIKLAVDYYGKNTAVPRMRKHIAWYIKGMPYSTEIKSQINHITEQHELEMVLKNYVLMLKEKSL
ncbi:MAG: tRNA dihydrouridine synthase DusB [Halanaerobiaceae bacterium]